MSLPCLLPSSGFPPHQKSNADPDRGLQARCGLILPACSTRSLFLSLLLSTVYTDLLSVPQNTWLHPPSDPGTYCSLCPQIFPWQAPSSLHKVSLDVISQRTSLTTRGSRKLSTILASHSGAHHLTSVSFRT